MIFSSYRFIFLFFPVVFLGFQLLRRTGRPAWVKLWLVAASLVFYGVGQPDFFLVFLASILFNYGVMTAMDKAGRPWLRGSRRAPGAPLPGCARESSCAPCAARAWPRRRP